MSYSRCAFFIWLKKKKKEGKGEGRGRGRGRLICGKPEKQMVPESKASQFCQTPRSQGPRGVSIVPASVLDVLSHWEGLFSDWSVDECIRKCLRAKGVLGKGKGCSDQAELRNEKRRRGE